MDYNIAIVGATGAVGREMMEILSYRKFPCKKIYALASKSSLGKEVSFGEDKVLKIEALEDFDFSKVDIALFSAGSNVSKKYAPIASKKNCVVIDNSSFFRIPYSNSNPTPNFSFSFTFPVLIRIPRLILHFPLISLF